MQQPRIRNLVNAFIPDAPPSLVLPSDALRAIDRFSRKWGGLWVGGSVEISPEGILFSPNSLNKAVHVGLQPVHIRSQDVLSVRHEFGWFTGIVAVAHTTGEFRFRCYGAKRLAAVLARSYCAP